MDQRAVANLTEMTEATNRIKLLQQQLAEANKELVDWKIDFNVQVTPNNGAYDVHITGEAGGKVVTKVLSQTHAKYFIDDKHTIAHSLAQQFIIELLTEHVVSKLGPPLSRAIDNVDRLSISKGL
jgi:hypothetical protein